MANKYTSDVNCISTHLYVFKLEFFIIYCPNLTSGEWCCWDFPNSQGHESKPAIWPQLHHSNVKRQNFVRTPWRPAAGGSAEKQTPSYIDPPVKVSLKPRLSECAFVSIWMDKLDSCNLVTSISLASMQVCTHACRHGRSGAHKVLAITSVRTKTQYTEGKTTVTHE